MLWFSTGWLAIGGCAGVERWRAEREPASPHARYALALRRAGLDSAALGREWLAASDSALQSPVTVTPPFQESGHYVRSEARAVAYRLALTEGQLLSVRLTIDSADVRIFADLYATRDDTLAPFRHIGFSSRDSGSLDEVIRHEVRATGDYLLRIQPELLRAGSYTVTIAIGPTLAFPVEGHDNRAVQSLFGADREGGRRRHHGIDIFAPRGTPVIAAAPGTVRSTSPNELGGNVVWLSDPQRGQTMYYAHLDRGIVSEGQDVQAGDTLGFVGNTGNARTTKPHLHFGIYRRGFGPVDPYPYVRLTVRRPETIVADTKALGADRIIASGARVALRAAPASRADTVLTVPAGTRVRIVGAVSSYYRVLQENGIAGYVPARAMSP